MKFYEKHWMSLEEIMQVEVQVNPSKSIKSDFAYVSISCKELRLKSVVDFDFSPLADYHKKVPPIALDFVFIATVIYCVDKMISRDNFLDRWTRDFQVTIPVVNIKTWKRAKDELENCLSFLTGDIWRIRFTELKSGLYRPIPKKRRQKREKKKFAPNGVCLFSGGLDSLIGAINWLEQNTNKKLLLVGHHDGAVAGPLSDQNLLFNILKDYYKDRVDILKVRVGQRPAGDETTYRSRSLLFIALGMYATQAIDQNVPLHMPENGTIAINVPLTPSRRGSCSTRTAHPLYLNLLDKLLKQVGINNTIINPLSYKTKGEGAEECLNQGILRKTALDAVSCAKRGHNRIWKNRSAKSCGFCMPCIYRRAALHKIKLDNQSYGLNICEGDITIRESSNVGNDLRAILSFLNNCFSRDKITSILVECGGIPKNNLSDYSDLVFRAMNEAYVFFRDKGNKEIKEYIGIKT